MNFFFKFLLHLLFKWTNCVQSSFLVEGRKQWILCFTCLHPPKPSSPTSDRKKLESSKLLARGAHAWWYEDHSFCLVVSNSHLVEPYGWALDFTVWGSSQENLSLVKKVCFHLLSSIHLSIYLSIIFGFQETFLQLRSKLFFPVKTIIHFFVKKKKKNACLNNQFRRERKFIVQNGSLLLLLKLYAIYVLIIV